MSTTKRSADDAFAVEQFPGTPESAPSPAASTSTADYPPRKRSRSEVTPEERKEARAHRNRIAAQNSRDRRKAQFSYLERRVAELEEENRQLRAGSGILAVQEHSQRSVDIAREKENQELRERIKTLEQGWDAVIKALAASGLPLAVPHPPSVAASSCPASLPLTASPAQPIFPPSPAPSHSSSHGNEFDDTGGDHRCPSFIFGVPAAGGFATNQLELELSPSPSPSTPQLSFSETSSAASPVDESAMENLLREILAPSPLLSSAPLPINTTSDEESSPKSQALTPSTLDWEGEQEMQRLLDMLPDVHPDMKTQDVNLNAVDFSPSLDVDLSTWDLGSIQPPLITVGPF